MESHTDIYYLTFVLFKNVNNSALHRELVTRCAMCFFGQMALIALIFNESEGINGIIMGTTQINSARIICAVILHLTLLPEIRQSIEMMEYISNNMDQFYGGGAGMPYIAALMKLISGLFTEIVCIILTIQAPSVDGVIKDFIAFGFIAEIDNIVALTLE